MKTKDMILIALFTCLIAIGAFIKLPISIVPVTLQVLFILLASLVLKEKAYLACLLYLFMGLIGLPVFTNGGGISYVLMPSFGYLVGFIFASYYIGRYQNNFKSIISRMIIGILIIYSFGLFYFVIIEYFYYHKIFGINFLLVNLFLIYLPGDIISICLAYIIYQRIRPIIE